MTTLSSANQQQRILEVAKTLFTKRGFSNVSMRDICREARVTPPTIYYHFKNKEALFDTVIRETITMSKFAGRLNDKCSKAGRPVAQIRAFTKTYLSSFPNKLINVGLYVRHTTELDSIGTKTLLSELEGIQSLLMSIIRKGILAGEFRKTDPHMASECLLGMMNRFIFQSIHFRRSYNASEAASYLSDFFLEAMKGTGSR